MASTAHRLSAESLSSSDAQPQDIGFNEPLHTYQSAAGPETPTRQPSPPRIVLKSPPKNGIPPKRFSATTKRTTPSNVSAPSTSNPPQSRGAPGTGLSKPPTRLSGSSAARRPATSVTAATATSLGHQKRPSVASRDLNIARRSDNTGAEENMKPTGNKSEARRSVYEKGDLKNTMQTVHADRLNLATKGEQGAVSSRMSSVSPTKSALRCTTNNARPSSIQTTSKSIRPTTSSMGGQSRAEATRKRLSTIAASPSPAKHDISISEPSVASQAVKATRPVLHGRKSTMSTTIEQRLREMELVHDMLHVAMAEEGDEDDEVKEEYGRKVDESLATLRSKLADARRNGGIVPRESEASGTSSEHGSGVETGEANSSHGKLQEALRESEGKVSAMSDTITDLQKRLEEAISCVAKSGEPSPPSDELSRSHQTELAAIRAEGVQAEARHQEELARLADNQAKAIDMAISQCSAEAAKKLESEVHAYTLKLEKLERDFAAEKEKGVLAASVSEELRLEIDGLQINRAHELEEVERVSLKRHQDLEFELSAVRDQLSQSELSHQAVISSHDRETEGKDEEIKKLAEVIDEFQAQMQDIHEQKERAVDETKLDLIEEHEKVVSDLHKKNHEDAIEVALANEQKLDALQAEHENALRSAEAKWTEDIRMLEDLLEVSEAAKESAELTVAEGRTVIGSLEVQVASLKSERDEVSAGKSLLDDAFKHASNKIPSFKETLQTLEDNIKDKDKLHTAAITKLVEQLADATEALEERSTERELMLQSHAEEINKLTTLHSVNIQTLESRRQDALLDLQKDFADVQARLNQAEKSHGVELRTIKYELAETVNNHAKDLANLQATQAKEAWVQLVQIENTHREEICALVESQDQICKSLREELKLSNEQLQQLKDSHDGPTSAERCEALVKEVDVLKTEVANSQVEFARANVEIARLTTEVEEARRTLQDSTESDHLRYEMFELTKQHAAEISRIQHEADLEIEKRAKERRQGAEVMDRLVTETEKLRNDLSAAKSEIEQYVQDLRATKAERQEAMNRNAADHEVIELHKAEHRKATDELQLLRQEVEKLKRPNSQGRTDNPTPHSQELEALQIAADTERQQNAKLRNQLQEAKASAERQTTKLREVESALKVTTAELVEAQTVRPHGSEYSTSQAPSSGLRLSRWANTDVADQAANSQSKQDENFGFTIAGNMAGIIERFRQLGDLNNDMVEEQKWIVAKLASIGQSKASSLTSHSSPGKECS